MNRVPDRKKQRREYLQQVLRRKLAGSAYALCYALCFVVTTIIAVIAAVAITFGLFLADESSCGVGCVLMMLAALSAWLMSLFRHSFENAREGVAKLRYVPPVTPDTLPAEEVLVRGAEQPSATSKTLLRPVTDDIQTPSEHLLRATNGVESEPL